MASILVVDDEPGFRKILSIVVRRAGHTAALASNVDEARAALAVHLPDAIILDDDMPGGNGSDFCLALKRTALTAHIPVIMYSSNPRLQQPGAGERIGASAVVKKPSLPVDLTVALHRCLQRQAGV